MGGTGLDWTGLDWTEQDSTSRNWIVAVVFYGLGVFRMEIHCNELVWMGLDWSERDKTVLDQRETMLDFTRLHYTALSWMNWKSTYSIVCIALDWTWKEFSGLP